MTAGGHLENHKNRFKKVFAALYPISFSAFVIADLEFIGRNTKSYANGLTYGLVVLILLYSPCMKSLTVNKAGTRRFVIVYAYTGILLFLIGLSSLVVDLFNKAMCSLDKESLEISASTLELSDAIAVLGIGLGLFAAVDFALEQIRKD